MKDIRVLLYFLQGALTIAAGYTVFVLVTQPIPDLHTWTDEHRNGCVYRTSTTTAERP